jgi:hypothetical protein
MNTRLPSVMHSPRLNELPAPPAGRTGWPWTEESPPLPATMPDGTAWPVISVVTPSFNQGAFLEETLRSVLLQGYPNLEFFVMDGGSTDASVEIIKKYGRWLTHWESKRDRGQAHAINKGLARCTGEIFNWINSDDYLLPGALSKIAGAFASADAVAGTVINFDDQGHWEPLVSSELEVEKLILGDQSSIYHQPGLWLKRDKVIACGGVDDSFQYAFDWDLTLRYLSLYLGVNYIPDVLAHFRLHPQSKTISAKQHMIEDWHRVLVKLRDGAPTAAARRACDVQLRTLNWWKLLPQFTEDARRPRLMRATQIALAACRDPRVRITRLTLGAIRRLLFPMAGTETN